MEENKSGGLLQALLFGGGSGSGGASSLADLSDVEISTSAVGDAEPLLRFDGETQMWVNCTPQAAILGPYYNDGNGAIVLEDGTVRVQIGIPIDINSTAGQTFSQLFQAAIAFGQYQVDGLSTDDFRPMVLAAANAVVNNADVPYLVYDGRNLLYTYRLVGANSGYAVWSGVILYSNSKFYRITFAIMCGANVQTASIVVKAEELMTYTEPT